MYELLRDRIFLAFEKWVAFGLDFDFGIVDI